MDVLPILTPRRSEDASGQRVKRNFLFGVVAVIAVASFGFLVVALPATDAANKEFGGRGLLTPTFSFRKLKSNTWIILSIVCILLCAVLGVVVYFVVCNGEKTVDFTYNAKGKVETTENKLKGMSPKATYNDFKQMLELKHPDFAVGPIKIDEVTMNSENWQIPAKEATITVEFVVKKMFFQLDGKSWEQEVLSNWEQTRTSIETAAASSIGNDFFRYYLVKSPRSHAALVSSQPGAGSTVYIERIPKVQLETGGRKRIIDKMQLMEAQFLGDAFYKSTDKHPDPYLVIKSTKSILKTKYKKNPARDWDGLFSESVLLESDVDNIQIEVWDDDFRSDDHMATFDFALPNLPHASARQSHILETATKCNNHSKCKQLHKLRIRVEELVDTTADES